LPPYCLGHLRSKKWLSPGEVAYRYDLWPVPVIPRPAHGRVDEVIVCGTCGRRLIYRVSSFAQVLRGRRRKSAAALAVIAAGAGYVVAFIVLVFLVPWGGFLALGIMPLGILLLSADMKVSMTEWDASARLVRPGRRHKLRRPGSAEDIRHPSYDTYVM
jgi:hypothetical protein